MSPISLCMLGVVSLVAVGSLAKAEAIPLLQNTTTGKTVFHDDFEAYNVPKSPTLLTKPSTSEAVEEVVASSWVGGMVFNPFGTLELGIANKSRGASGKVAAKQGKQFLMMSGVPGDPVGQTWKGNGDYSRSLPGDTIKATISFYLTSGSNRGLFYLYGGPDQDQLLAAFGLNGINPRLKSYSLATHNGVALEQTSLRFTPDVWNTLTVTHTNGTASWDVSINGGPMITVAGYQDATAYNLNAIFFNQTTDSATGTTVYFDAVDPRK